MKRSRMILARPDPRWDENRKQMTIEYGGFMKKKELIESLRRLASDITAIAEALEGNEEAASETPAAKQPLPEKKTYSFEEARARLATLVRSGRREAVKAILSKYGVTMLSELKGDPEKLTALVDEAEVIGNA